mmetsp:Transcript_1429/g.3176  ORF Transcript_1429/g.3176 Transcript_1429/m.3176 type:complete len:110 (-) Transcript_1429:676-1005(-)
MRGPLHGVFGPPCTSKEVGFFGNGEKRSERRNFCDEALLVEVLRSKGGLPKALESFQVNPPLKLKVFNANGEGPRAASTATTRKTATGPAAKLVSHQQRAAARAAETRR